MMDAPQHRSQPQTGAAQGWLERLGERIAGEFATSSLPLSLRYGLTFGLVVAANLLHGAFDHVLSGYPLLIFVPAIFVAAIAFGGGSGFIATVLSAISVAYFFVPPHWSFDLRANDWAALGVFLLVGLLISSVTEALRSAMKRLRHSDERRRLFLQEINHRTKNDMAMVISMLHLQAGRSANGDVAEALQSAAQRIFVFSDAQKLLQYDERCGTIDVQDYVQALCRAQDGFTTAARGVVIHASCVSKTVPVAAAITLGLILNELITNALKYAFPDGRGGQVTVSFACSDDTAELLVEDDGVGCPDEAPAGLGSKLINLLTGQISGHLSRESGPGTRVRVTVPLKALGRP